MRYKTEIDKIDSCFALLIQLIETVTIANYKEIYTIDHIHFIKLRDINMVGLEAIINFCDNYDILFFISPSDSNHFLEFNFFYGNSKRK
jgi:hypothetical protein